LTGKVTVKLYKKERSLFQIRWKLIDTMVSENTGIEYGSKKDNEFNKFFVGRKSLFKN